MTRADDRSSPAPASRGWRDRLRAVPWLMAGAPWWVAVLVGLVLTALGGFLIFRPLTALGGLWFYLGISCLISGVADLLTVRGRPDGDAQPTGFDLVRPVLWIVAGVLLLTWLGRDLQLLVPAVAALLIASGVLALVRLIAERTVDRVIGALFGLAEILFGLLALLWPDLTLIVVAVLFGGRTALFGLTSIVRGLQQRLGGHTTATPDPTSDPAAGSAAGATAGTAAGTTTTAGRRWMIALRFTAAACVLVLAVGTTWVSHQLRQGIPVLDEFYAGPDTPMTAPGQLIRWDAYDGNLPDGLIGYRIYYVTTNEFDILVPSTGLFVIPEHLDDPAPLITWAHGTVGVARACAPSLNSDAFAPDMVPATERLAELGWAMVATDYPGMGAAGDFPYLIGQGQGRATLDAARAARQLPGTNLSDQTVIWGHSQGGHAALWAGQLAASYAPDLDVVGTAALSPASNPRALADSVLSHPDRLGASLGIAFVVDAYTRYYPDLDVDEVVVPAARVLVREAASRCTSSGGTLVTVLAGLSIGRDQPIVDTTALDGDFGDRLVENIPRGPFSAPLFIGQGESDEVIAFAINTAYVADLCAAGTDVEFIGYPGGSHMSVLQRGAPMMTDLVTWTTARLAGEPSTPTC